MRDLPPAYLKRKLLDITLPGSHDTGAYKYTSDQLDQYQSPLIQTIQTVIRAIKDKIPILGPFLDSSFKDIVWSWGKTQNLDITGQLERGIRFLDLRTMMYQGQPHLFHGFVAVPVTEALQQVKAFTDKWPTEIVLLAFSHMSTLADADHVTLADAIKATFKDALFTDSDLSSKTVAAMQGKGRIVVFHDADWAARGSYPWLLKQADYYQDIGGTDPNNLATLVKEYDDSIRTYTGTKPLVTGFTITPADSDIEQSIWNRLNPTTPTHDLKWFTRPARDELSAWMAARPAAKLGIMTSDFVDETTLLECCLRHMNVPVAAALTAATPTKNYDIAFGTDNLTLNPIVGQVYSALYPALLRQTIKVGMLNIASITFDIDQPPTIDLSPSADARAYFEEALNKHNYDETVGLLASHKQAIVELAVAASFQFTTPSVAVSINYSGGQSPTTVKASLHGSATIRTSAKGGNHLSVQIISATASVAGDPVSTALLNSAFIPAFLPYLNDTVLSNFNVPALSYGSLQVSMPVPTVQAPFVVAYSALGSDQPDVPLPRSWPSGCVFLASDAAAVTAAAKLVFPQGWSDGFNWGIVSGRVGGQAFAPTDITVNGDGSLSAKITAEAVCQLTLHTPWPLPNFDFGPRARATIGATLIPSVSNGDVSIVIQTVSVPSFDFDWGSIPWYVEPILFPIKAALALALNAVLSPLISSILSNFKIRVYSLPTISFDVEGKQINLKIVNAATSSADSRLVVRGQISVTGASKLQSSAASAMTQVTAS